MNLRLIDGILDAIDTTGLTAALRPTPERCCVRREQRGELG